jgi:hypothetical protein
MVLLLASVISAVIGAWAWDRAVKRDVLRDKEWILANTVFKDTFMAELRALEVDAESMIVLIREAEVQGSENKIYWSGKLQAFRDVIRKLGGKIYGK